MKKIFLILAFTLVSCTANEYESGTTEQCFRIVQINYTENFIVLDINGQDVKYYVQNVTVYRINQNICNLNEIQ